MIFITDDDVVLESSSKEDCKVAILILTKQRGEKKSISLSIDIVL